MNELPRYHSSSELVASSYDAPTQFEDTVAIDPLEGRRGFESRLRTLDLEILNGTSVHLRFVEEYFFSGSWFVPLKPVNIPPGVTGIAYVASRYPSLIGVKGGLMFELHGTDKFLYIGFDNPTIGYYKTFIELCTKRLSAKWAAEQTRNDAIKNNFDGGYHVMAIINPAKLSKYRLFVYSVEEIDKATQDSEENRIRKFKGYITL